MRHARGEGRAIVEGVRLLAFGKLKLAVKGIDLSPKLENAFFLLWKVNGHFGHLVIGKKAAEIWRL
jgi:hypothetical protein